MSLFSRMMKQLTVQGVHSTTGLGNSADIDRKFAEYDQQDATMSMSSPRQRSGKVKPKNDTDEEIDQVRGVKPKGKSFPLAIKKVDPEQRIVGGWASVAVLNGERIIDKQGDIIPIDELDKAARDYVLNSRDGGDMHSKRGVSKLAASIVFTPEKEKFGIVAKDDQGRTIYGWWTEFYVHDDDLWAAFKRGERPEFSIGGQAIPIEVEATGK
jgi:hypothetical protein